MDSSDHKEKIRVEIVRTLKELEAYRDEWNRLAFQSQQHLPVLSWASVASRLEHLLGPNESWICLLAVADSGRLVGVLPLMLKPHRWFRWHCQLNVPEPSVDFLVAPGLEYEVISLLVSALDQAAPNWFSLKLTRIPEISPTLELSKRCPPGIRVSDEFQVWGSLILIEGGWENYLAGWDKKYHRNIRRFTNKLNGLPGVKTTVIAGQEAAAEQHLKNFLELEASGWKGKSETAILNSPKVTKYYQDLTQRLADCGWLEWHFLEAQGKIIAANLAIRCSRALILSKIAYDERYSEFAPGLVLRMNIIERAFKSGDTEEINFISDMPGHEKWRMHQRTHHKIVLFPRRFMPSLFGFVPTRLRIILRRISGSKPPAHKSADPVGSSPQAAF